MGDRDRGWNCMDPDGLLSKAFQVGEPAPVTPVHELMQHEPNPQFDPGVLEAGGLVPTVVFESGQPS